MAATGHLGQLGKEAAAIIGQSVVVVTADLTAVNRQDTANTVEYAARISNVKGVPKGWLAEYVHIASKLGWTNAGSGFHEVDLSQVADGATVADLVKDLLVQPVHDLGEKEKEVMKLAVDSLVKEKNRREFFNSFIPDGKNIVFAVTVATIKDGVLTAQAAAFECEATEEITDCLLFKINETNININIRQYHVNFSVNQGVFDANRKMVEERLQASPGKYVEEIPLN